MYIFVIALVILLFCTFTFFSKSDWAYDIEGPCVGATVVTGLTILLMTIALMANNCSVSNDVNQLLIVKQEIEKARSNPNMEAERVAFLPKVIEYNQQVASYKYWNNTQWDLWIPDELADLEPIK